MSRTPTLAALAAALVLGAGALACSPGGAAPLPPPASTAGAATAQAAGLPRLVFFMNPNGRPCQLQDQVLEQLAPSLEGHALVVRVRTTTPADLGLFERYGIRSLPQLVVTDAGGRELRRATPGIQPAEQVLQLLGR